MKLYGAKCHLCTHIRHEGSCVDCTFCRLDNLDQLIKEAGLDIFTPEVQDAVAAFKRGDSHPLLTALHTEIAASTNEAAS